MDPSNPYAAPLTEPERPVRAVGTLRKSAPSVIATTIVVSIDLAGFLIGGMPSLFVAHFGMAFVFVGLIIVLWKFGI